MRIAIGIFFLIAYRERGNSKTMSLTPDFLYPQFLVLVLLRNEKGEIVDFDSVAVYATRRDALSFISLYEKELSSSLRSDAFDSYTDALTPAFRLYHLTRAKI